MEKSEALALVTEALGDFTEAQKQSWSRNASGMPRLEGETYHVKTITKDSIKTETIGAGAANAGDKYKQIPTVEGTMLGFSQIARKGNGLGLEGETRMELVADFVYKVNTYNEQNPDSAGFPFKVKSLKTRPGQSGQMVIPTYQLL